MTLTTKQDIRKSALGRRDAVDPETRARFAARLAELAPRLLLDAAPAGETLVVALFFPIGSEPDTLPAAQALQAAGVPLALPVDTSPGNPLTYRAWTPGDLLASGPLGISEPLEDAERLDPDVLFVPMAAFDRRGHRVGYGAGNVDRTLATLRARKPIRAIGVAYAAQEELFIPDAPHDETLDVVVTEREIIVCQP